MAEGLGWLLPVPGSILANQLAELGRMHPISKDTDEKTAQLLAAAVPRCCMTCLLALLQSNALKYCSCGVL